MDIDERLSEINKKIVEILAEENLNFGEVCGILENTKFVMWVAHMKSVGDNQ